LPKKTYGSRETEADPLSGTKRKERLYDDVQEVLRVKETVYGDTVSVNDERKKGFSATRTLEDNDVQEVLRLKETLHRDTLSVNDARIKGFFATRWMTIQRTIGYTSPWNAKHVASEQAVLFFPFPMRTIYESRSPRRVRSITCLLADGWPQLRTNCLL
jgi:hypothetical protein